MAIEIHAQGQSAEDVAARQLAALIRSADPEAARSGKAQVCIIAQVQCYGHSPQDLDIVLLVNDQRERGFQSTAGVRLESCCVAIEVKSHTSDGVCFVGPQCYVRYREELHNVSRQSEAQKWSLLGYLGEHLPARPYVTNVIWMTQLPSASGPQTTSNVIGSDATWMDFVDRITQLSGAQRGVCRALASTRAYFDAVSVLTRHLQPSALDRRKLEAICQRVGALDTQYLQRMGEQLLVFRGRGGTGKTIRLLRLAHHLYSQQDARALLLTYNKALTADISRLLSILRIQDGVGERGVGVKTIYQLMYRWLVSLQLVDPHADDFLLRYADLKRELLECLRSGAITPEDVMTARAEHSRMLAWDFILIDESQDWPADERDLLYLLYGFRQLIVSDGVEQLVRETERADWREHLTRSDSQVVTLRKSLRLKSGLCTVVNAIASELGVPDWELEPEPHLHGGRLIVLVGTAYTQATHAALLSAHQAHGNHPIDMLLCVPPTLVHVDTHGQQSAVIAESLKSWGYQAWDGTSSAARESFPVSLEEHRIVQYESCRGLEGWTVVCLALDELYDRKHAEPIRERQESLLISHDALRDAFAARWVMIPLTRAIDSLVIQVERRDHPISRTLRRVWEQYPELIEWREA